MNEELMKLLMNNVPLIETLLLSTSLIYVDRKVNKSFVLRRKYLDKRIMVEAPPLLIQNARVFNSNEFDEEFRKDIIRFYNILIKNVKPDNLTSFYDNIHSLTINKNSSSKLSLKNFSCSGLYYPTINEITLAKPYNKTALFHELLHLSSSCIREGIVYVGFNQTTHGKDQGRGINEGYTEYLNEKFFKITSDASKIYKYLMGISSQIEKIIGEEKMQDYYFSSDLLSLYYDLCKYIDFPEVDLIIKNTDYLYSVLRKKKDSMMQQDLIVGAFRQINDSLLTIYINKLKQENNPDINNKVNEFKLLLPLDYYSGYKTYYIEDAVDLNELVNSELGKNRNI